MNKKMFLVALVLGMVHPAWAQGGAVVPLAQTALKPVGNGMVDALGRTVINGVTFPALRTVPMLTNASFPELLTNPPTMTEHVTVTPVEVKKEVLIPSAPEFIKNQTALPQTRTITEVKEVVTKNFESHDDAPGRLAAIQRAAQAEIRHLQLLEALEQMKHMKKGIEYQRTDYQFADTSYINKRYPNRWDLILKRPEAVADAKAYWEDVAVYRATFNEIQSFYEHVKSLMERKSLGQKMDQRTINTVREKANLLRKRIQILDETVGMRPWELIQKIRYLQQVEYYFMKFVEGKIPCQLPQPILKPNPAKPDSFYSWYLSSRDDENAPKNLRIAVVHDDKNVYKEMKRDIEKSRRKWEIRSFTVQEFLKERDYSYDVVVGDFYPPKHQYAIIRNPYSRLLHELTFSGNGGILILSAPTKEPGTDLKEFAKLSVDAGIEGTLKMWEDCVAYRRHTDDTIINFYWNKWRKK